MGGVTSLTRVDVDAGIALMVAVSEPLKHPVDLLGFLGKLNLHEQFANSHVDGISEKGKSAHVAAQHGEEERIVGFAQETSDDALVEVFGLDSFQVVSWRFALFSDRQNERLAADVHGVLM
jgi:hypothetical protein